MMLINCPFCGPRDEIEFSCGGEAHIARPLAENTLSDKDFAEYLFMRDNAKGVFLERWCHIAGCRRWFNMARDTVSHEIIEIYPIGALPKNTSARSAYEKNQRRLSAAEKASIPAQVSQKRVGKIKGVK